MHTYYVEEYELYHLFDLSSDTYDESFDAGTGSYEPVNTIGKFDTIEDAWAACCEYASEQWGDAGWFEVIGAKIGPDGLKSREILIEEFDEDDEFVDAIGGERSLPDGVRKAMERVTRSYQAWKDYQGDDWVDLPMAIEEMA